MNADPYYPEARERFVEDVAEHQVEVLHDDGTYRHIVCKEPGSSFYWFELITSPWQLTIRGDMGCYVFSRIHDMFDFFGDRARAVGDYINPGYWTQKLESTNRQGVEDFSQQAYLKWLADNWEDRRDDYGQAARNTILNAMYEELTDADSHESAMEVLDGFDVEGYVFTDTWEHHFTDYDSHYLWCLNAIVWCIEKYRAAAAA
ncbi:hypothetical protein [Subtercola sp. RTI3]|uniref:hypothetical protein n=1 Tax=Subtercola sp. RTI3 TaxID=3048639 RepID=UPI002B22BC21|nr:hypothetical protein [Subtercola sp. RTI3]MEA9983684.1 hypothetical protein [Subtercola sp. RTI3]